MRKNITLIFLMMFFLNAVSSFAYALDSKNTKQITVAKKGGNYKKISDALKSITDASKKNPYVINVMPGTYEESIVMKPYVDLIGSGQENTKITSSKTFTVMGANNSTLENIWVDSTGAAKSKFKSKSYDPAAILNDNTSMTINKVKVTMNNPVPPLMEAYGIATFGSSKSIISNCTVNAKGSNQRGLIGIGGNGDPTIKGCIITVDTSGASFSFWNVGVLGSNVENSVIKVKGANHNRGVEKTTIKNSKIESIATSNSLANDAAYYSKVTNSEIIMLGRAKEDNCAVTGSKIEKSLIGGPVCGINNKIANSWDKDKKPIPNR